MAIVVNPMKTFSEQKQASEIFDQTLGKFYLLRIHAFDSHSSYAGGHDSTLSNIPKINPDPLNQVPKLIPQERSHDYLNTLKVYSHHLNILNSIFDENYNLNLQYVNFKNRHCRLVNLNIETGTNFSTEIILELGSIPAIVHDEYIKAFLFIMFALTGMFQV